MSMTQEEFDKYVQGLDAIQNNFRMARFALIQAMFDLERLGFCNTKQQVRAVVDDLQLTIMSIDRFKADMKKERDDPT